MNRIILTVACALIISCSCLAQEKAAVLPPEPGELIRAVKSSRNDSGLALENVRALIEQGADVNYVDRYGVTPLAYAADVGDLEMTEYLLSKGARHDAGTERPLIIAAGMGRLNIVEFYLENGIPIDTVSAKGETALQVALRWDQPGVVAYLRSKGAK